MKQQVFEIPNSEDLTLEQLEAAHAKLYFELKAAGYYVVLNWHDPEKHDFLMVSKFDEAFKVNAAAAKGVTPYDLIALYGDPETVAKAFPERDGAVYGDCSGAPEMFNEDMLIELAGVLNKKYGDALAKKEAAKAQAEAEKAKAEKVVAPEVGKEGNTK